MEVDFLLRRGSDLCAIEVKASRRFHLRQLAGLRAIGDLAGLQRRVLIYRGDRTFETEEGIEVWPVPVFLEALESGGLWQ